MKRSIRLPIALVVGLALASACATERAATHPQPRATEEVSFDGLHRIENTRFSQVWIRTGTDFAGYTKLLVLPAEFTYKRPPTRNRMASDNFALNDRQMKRLRALLRDVFRDELVEKGGWQIAEAPGPDVLLVQGGLLDMVVHVPPPSPNTGALGGTFVSSYGEATLVMQFYDSETRQILGRIADRREAEPAGPREFSQADISASADLRVFFRRWAVRLREGLDEVRARSAPAAAPAP